MIREDDHRDGGFHMTMGDSLLNAGGLIFGEIPAPNLGFDPAIYGGSRALGATMGYPNSSTSRNTCLFL